DLKPENLFITTSGLLKILDFGIAKLAPEMHPSDDSATTAMGQTDTGAVIGTAPYVSPEQARAQRVDVRSDIFSIGTILYEMLSGQNPFRRESVGETMHAAIREPPPSLSESGIAIPPALERIVFHCLEKNAKDRFQSARDLAFALEALSIISGSAP